jgi:glycosyltransferase involved in cell wall biosynthesis
MNYSVVIPAYNAAATISEALGSVLKQTKPPAEIFVVNDGSTDETASIAAAFDRRVRVINQENAGPGAASTAGILASSAAVVAMLDADDLWVEDKMAIQLGHLASVPDCHAVFGHVRAFRADGQEFEAYAGWSRITLAIRRSAALQIGPVIDPEGGRGEMVDWFARARELGLRFDMLDQVLALRRIRPGSLSYGRDDEKDRGYLRVAWLALQRKKALKP